MFLVSCKDKYPVPLVQLCLTDSGYVSQCVDKRLPEGEQEYEQPYEVNQVCSSIESYSIMAEYCMNLRSLLIRCEKQ